MSEVINKRALPPCKKDQKRMRKVAMVMSNPANLIFKINLLLKVLVIFHLKKVTLSLMKVISSISLGSIKKKYLNKKTILSFLFHFTINKNNLKQSNKMVEKLKTYRKNNNVQKSLNT